MGKIFSPVLPVFLMSKSGKEELSIYNLLSRFSSDSKEIVKLTLELAEIYFCMTLYKSLTSLDLTIIPHKTGDRNGIKFCLLIRHIDEMIHVKKLVADTQHSVSCTITITSKI